MTPIRTAFIAIASGTAEKSSTSLCQTGPR